MKKALIFLLLLLTTGCWDMLDIDKRAMITALGIDQYNVNEAEQENSEPLMGAAERPRYLISIEIPNLSAVGGTGSQEAGGSQSASYTLRTTATSLAHATTLFDLRLWRRPFYGHTKVVVVGEETARDGLKDIFNFFHHRQDINRGMKICIAKGEAREVLDIKPVLEGLTGVYLSNIIEMAGISGRLLTTDFGEAARDLFTTGNTLLPRVVPADTEATLGGSALIKDWKMVGWLGEIETLGSMLVLGKIRGGKIFVGSPASQYGERTFDIRNTTCSITTEVIDSKVHFRIKLFLEGDIFEQIGGSMHTVDSGDWIGPVQELLNVEIEKIVRNTIEKMQSFKADCLHLGKVLSAQHPKYWAANHERWNEEIFPNIELDVNANVVIRRIGVAF